MAARVLAARSTPFEGAGRLLLDRGWIQEHAKSGEGRCLSQALFEVTSFENARRAIGILNELVPTHFASTWQDQPGRTLTEVLKLLIAAASRW